jgi:hypothetical protein
MLFPRLRSGQAPPYVSVVFRRLSVRVLRLPALFLRLRSGQAPLQVAPSSVVVPSLCSTESSREIGSYAYVVFTALSLCRCDPV